MLISLIVPMYNAENYIDKCLDSILAQTYQDYEVVLINDGSTDKTSERCRAYTRRDKRFQLIGSANKGPAGARRIGIMESKGDYIMFVDADDWLEPDMLERTWKLMQEQQADMVCTGHKEVRVDGTVKSVLPQMEEMMVLEDHEQMMHHLHGTRIIDSGPWAKLVRRKLFGGIDYCENATVGEDYFMVLQLLEKAQKVVQCTDALYDRCMRPNGISRSGYTKRHKAAFEEYGKWREYLLERYPALGREIVSYHLEYEMAVITAMCRNRQYDEPVIQMLSQDLRRNLLKICTCAKTPFYAKGSAVLIAFMPGVFIMLFCVIHKLTGR